MEPVRLATCRMLPAAAGRTAAASLPNDVETDGASWVRFGDELVYYGQG
jgi:hypothetical protein